jgi:hypothetical protein
MTRFGGRSLFHAGSSTGSPVRLGNSAVIACVAFPQPNGDGGMALTTVRPAAFDIAIANEIAANTGPHPEEAAEVLTWGADEHILFALAAGW